jgi:lipid II:glycine glycyltransferase (peptidoglycan interpeptide bridge formation enzyme)
MLSDLGFVVRRSLPAPARYCADVSLDEDAQLANFDQKWRYNLRQAQKNNFDIRLCDTEAEVAVFRQVHDDMTARKSLDRAARGMIDCLEDLVRLPDQIRMRVILVRHEGQPIAGATVGIVGDTAFYVLGATNQTALKLKAGYAMQWWIMRWLSTQNVHWYELGGTGDPGIRQFKKGLIGKRGVVLETGEYDKWTQNSARIATDIVYRLRDARDFVGRWVG